jgi:hypothetical protein
MLICLASFTSNYYKPFYFEATATVNLTSLLVLTTMFISVMESLPKTAYLKLVDIWLIVNLSLPFFVLVLQTYIEASRGDDLHADSVCRDSNENEGCFSLFNWICMRFKNLEFRQANEQTMVEVS